MFPVFPRVFARHSSAQALPRIRQSLLYVPGSSEKMLKKSVPADTLVFDLEDSVAEHRKGTARSLVLDALSATPSTDSELAVRINAPSTQPSLAANDLEVVLQSSRLQALVLPKVEQAADVAFVAERAAAANNTAPLALVLSVESARTLLHLPTILAKSRALLAERKSPMHVAAVLFASEDYCASTGVRRLQSRRGLLYPRAHMAMVAQAHDIQAIDMVCIDYKNEDYLAEECAEGAELGMDGKQAIHPAQLASIRRAFSPSEDDVAEAEAILAAYETGAREQNRGAVALHYGGRDLMIDAPMLLQARTTLARAQSARRS